MFKKILYTFTLLLILLNNTFAKNMKKIDQNNILYMELKDGIVAIEMFPEKAPNHVLRIRTLTREGFYDGLNFHRVIENFMVQTGDPLGNGTGSSKLFDLNAEFNNEMHTKGTVSMARSSNPNSANSQFFIVIGDYASHLDGQYTVWGRVIDGMQYIDNIKKGDNARNGTVTNPDKIIKMAIGSDLIGQNKEDKNGNYILKQLEEIRVIQKEKSKDSKKEKSSIEILMELNKR